MDNVVATAAGTEGGVVIVLVVVALVVVVVVVVVLVDVVDAADVDVVDVVVDVVVVDVVVVDAGGAEEVKVVGDSIDAEVVMRPDVAVASATGVFRSSPAEQPATPTSKHPATHNWARRRAPFTL